MKYLFKLLPIYYYFFDWLIIVLYLLKIFFRYVSCWLYILRIFSANWWLVFIF